MEPKEKEEELFEPPEPVSQEIIIKFWDEVPQEDVERFFEERRAVRKEGPPEEVRPSFDYDPEIMDAIQRNAISRWDRDVPRLSRFYRLRLTGPFSDEEIDELIGEYVDVDDPRVEYVARAALPGPPPAFGSFENIQEYLDQATGTPLAGGVGARFVWDSGWNGKDVRVCDCEFGFRSTHLDLPDVDVISNLDGRLDVKEEHGTQVLSVLAGRDDGKGVKGICFGATMLFASESGQHRVDCLKEVLVKVGFLFSVGLERESDLEDGDLSQAFRDEFSGHSINLSDDISIEPHPDGDKWHIKEESGARRTFVVVREDETLDIYAWGGGELKPGDVVLLEMQTGGLGAGGRPAEYDADVHAAVTTLVGLDVVVAAAGNADVDLDEQTAPRENMQKHIWQVGHPDFDDSGAILVGAGYAPNTLAHVAHAKIAASAYGSRVNCQGWGNAVVSAGGKGDLFKEGNDPDLFYTRRFKNTSSASAIVAGVVACLQSFAIEARGGPLRPLVIRDLLSQDANGTPQRDGVSSNPRTKHIGPLPNLCRLIEVA
jgi:hypothetical protein